MGRGEPRSAGDTSASGSQASGVAAEDARSNGAAKPAKARLRTHLHFEEQRLAFVHRHAAGPADRLTPPFLRQAALVEACPVSCSVPISAFAKSASS